MRKSHRANSVRSAFTLVELLVVIAIISLLAVIMLPTVQYAMELARRSKCKSNAKNIAEACLVYMNTQKYHDESNSGAGLPRKGNGPTTGNWSNGSLGNPASLWLLVQYKLVGRDVFLCPSAALNRDFTAPEADDNYFTSNTLSYSYLSQVSFTDNTSDAISNGRSDVQITSNLNQGLKASELALVADSNPRSRVGKQSLDSEMRGKNSLNHRGAGQNVAFASGHASWYTTTTIPGTNPLDNGAMDDIYQSAGSGESQGKRGAINDAFLIP
jgi:prepilin-type N-terminal cleavage/methylation domain-containing protein